MGECVDEGKRIGLFQLLAGFLRSARLRRTSVEITEIEIAAGMNEMTKVLFIFVPEAVDHGQDLCDGHV